MANPGADKPYRIVLQERTTALTPRNTPYDAYRFTFMMPDGTVDWVELPADTITPAKVDAAIMEKVKFHLSLVG